MVLRAEMVSFGRGSCGSGRSNTFGPVDRVSTDKAGIALASAFSHARDRVDLRKGRLVLYRTFGNPRAFHLNIWLATYGDIRNVRLLRRSGVPKIHGSS